MRRIRHLALACVLLLAQRAIAADADLDRLMALLAGHSSGHVSFVEQTFLSVLDRPVEAKGELLYVRPDRLEKRTLTPKPAALILDKGTLTVDSGGHKRILALADYPQIAPFVESIRATLAGDRTALERVFRLSFEGNLARWTLTLMPRDLKLTDFVRQIRIEGSDGDLHTVTILQTDGDRSIMNIGPPLPR